MDESLTFLIPNYNNGWAFPALLQSLENQTSPRWKALICDDCSTDDSWIVIRRLVENSPCSTQIELIQNDRNRGLTGTLIHLIERAETDIVAQLDADDALTPDATEELLKVYDSVPSAAFVYSKYVCMDEELNLEQSVEGRAIPSGLTSMQDGWSSHLRSFRRRLYWETEGYDESLLYAEDRDLVMKLEERTEPLFVDRVLYKYRHVPTSQSKEEGKKKIGLYNYGKAWNDALRRRKIGGVRNLMARVLFWGQLPYLPYRFLRPLFHLLQSLQLRYRWFQPGTLQRNGPWYPS